MKKIYALLLTVLMMFLLTACGSSAGDGILSSIDLTNGSEQSSSTRTSSENSTDSTTQSASNDSSATESKQSEQSTETLPEISDTASTVAPGYTSEEISAPASTENSESQQSESVPSESAPVSEPETSNVLVVYFSATNTTKGVAKHISEALNADLYEITPEIPYTSADLDYHDDGSRSTIEMNDSSSRPAISGSINNMEQYDIVFIGYPIWWGEAPRILSTFVESYSFSGKTIVPFCTSGGSGVGSSASNLERLSDGGAWLSGTRLSGSASRNDVVSWINGLGLDVVAE